MVAAAQGKSLYFKGTGGLALKASGVAVVRMCPFLLADEPGTDAFNFTDYLMSRVLLHLSF